MKILFYILQLRKQHFIITDTKLYVSVVILSIQNNAKLSQQLMSDFKRTIKCVNKKTETIFRLFNWS